MALFVNKGKNRTVDWAAASPPPVQRETLPLEDMWQRCPACMDILYIDDLQRALMVCPVCGYHFRLSADRRIQYTADPDSFCELDAGLSSEDPLAFPGYPEKLRRARQDTGLCDAMRTGCCTIGGYPCVLAVMDGFFMMGSMGATVGERFARAAETAAARRIPLLAFTVSGGARMQEGLVALMQMAKVSAVLGKLDQAGVPYFVVLTDPTTGGVTASFAMLGDVTLAEPGALVGFAGRRVIQQTVGQTLPENFQRAEFLLERGFVDAILPRDQLRDKLTFLLRTHAAG